MENDLHARDKVGLQDFVLLEDLSESAFVGNLHKRFKENLIYTYIGPVLISVNPYSDLKLYSDNYVKQYHNTHICELPPHIYAIADNAYHRMLEEGHDQCVLISGESGAGKTEASKLILKYIAVTTNRSQTVERVKNRLVHSNPVLESFGNAKTKRNDNSSRFGKYMDVEFDGLGNPTGGHILNYLLEKSRVVKQEEGERNFHIFYQLLAGESDLVLKKLHLKKSPKVYEYLNKDSECSHEDVKQYNDIKEALAVIDFTIEEKDSLLSIVASVLHLGNIKFVEESNVVHLKPESPVEELVELLGCAREDLTRALTHRSIEARGELLLSPLNSEQAVFVRDALAKAIYERMFGWLVSKINSSLQGDKDKGKKRKTVIGLLDIYGFEVFEKNRFEQFCINYCNEKLQQLFIELTLKSEQEEYLKEGIEWECVDYFNNKIICDLIEERHQGIISILDEECLRPGDATDLTFLEKLEENIGSHPHFQTHRLLDAKQKKTISREEFKLVHYAGEVNYQLEGFLDKNNDLLFRDLKKTMACSSNLIAKLTFSTTEFTNKKRPETAGTQFKASVGRLMKILKSKEPWYIRCIKPNDFKAQGVFSQDIVKHQVKYLGLIENLRVRRAGYSYRRPYEIFLKRYKCLCPATWPHHSGSASSGVQTLLIHRGYTSQHYKMGKTKVFIKYPKTLFEIEDAFQQRKHYLVSKIKACYKGYIQRKKYETLKKSALLISSYWKRHLVQRQVERKWWAVKVIRRFIRGFITRNDEPNEDNLKFSWYTKAEYLTRLVSALPTSVLDYKWPSSPLVCNQASEILNVLHKKWLVNKYCKSITNERKEQLQLKVLAEEIFKNKKSSYLASVPHKFVTSRLVNEKEFQDSSGFEKELKGSGEKILYASNIIKYDRHGYKPRNRIFVLSANAIFTFDDDKNHKLKQTLNLQLIQSISVSSFNDGFAVIRIPEDMKKEKGDLIIDCGEHLIEMMIKIVSASKNTSLINVETNNTIYHTMTSGKRGVINFSTGEEPSIIKDKNGALSVVVHP